jgi:DNA modification methylase
MNKIICGDALTVLRTLPDKSCRCCVTSPPYFNLRDYGVPGQIGLEPTMQEYIARLVEVFAEVKRVLTDDGTLWINIADSYAGSGKGAARYPENAKKYKQGTNVGSVGCAAITKAKFALPAKNLIGIPWRLAFALQDDGWILRQDIIWDKSNCMPESVRDRCTKSHEYIFLFAKRKRYYFNSEAILEPAVGFNNEPIAGSVGAFGQAQSRRRKGNSKTFRGGKYTAQNTFDNSRELSRNSHGNCENNTGKRRMRSVWNMATTATGGGITHYAKFPDELAERCILCGTAEGDVVLDPFAGSGTTCRVANRYGRQYIGIDLNPAYCKAAETEIPINLF